eukprot:gnl/Hemi2/28426_TR9400_c0_g1_i1.p1 gnl/Hemi2/28426_TR9400_c0_g1~~gnl/Hemi2/28426_TR9400_c0_g1_i1.p1  ORF type:complete len:664 (+),score=227.10 gnl/Hemi2/28426_TR9400_c0_g1_i1:169-2160(+)
MSHGHDDHGAAGAAGAEPPKKKGGHVHVELLDDPDEPTVVDQLKDWWRRNKTEAEDFLDHSRRMWFTKEGYEWFWGEAKKNWSPGLTVALVNLPLSISLSVAGGGSPVVGIITAIWAGLLSSLLGGSHFNITGPTGAISGLLTTAVSIHGAEILPFLAFFCGLICVVVWILELERFAQLVPTSVMEGFTLGVALIISLNQLNYALGLPAVPRHELFISNIMENLQHADQTNGLAVLIFLFTFVPMLMLALRWGTIPWASIFCLVGVIIGIMENNGVFPDSVEILVLQDRFPHMRFELFEFPAWSGEFFTMETFGFSMDVAFVAVLETLISAKIADSMTHTRFGPRREVFGLAVTNIIVGVFGGLPATAALARTSLNVNSGATSRVSALLGVIFMFVIAAVLLPGFRYLPLPVVAGMLCVVAVRMLDFGSLIMFWKRERRTLFMVVFIALICIVKDPTIGIVIGVIISLLLNADRQAVGHSDITTVGQPADDKSKEPNYGSTYQSSGNDHSVEMFGSVVVYRFCGQLSYVNLDAHKTRLMDSFPDCTVLILGLRHLLMFDFDGLDCLTEIVQHAEDTGKTVYICGVNQTLEPTFCRMPWVLAKRDKEPTEVFATVGEALLTIFPERPFLQSLQLEDLPLGSKTGHFASFTDDVNSPPPARTRAQ